MPKVHTSHRRSADELCDDDNGYDQELMRCTVMYDEINEQYICGYCLDDFSFSQLHATYGGNILPIPTFRSRKTRKHLHNELCGICGLPASRAFL